MYSDVPCGPTFRAAPVPTRQALPVRVYGVHRDYTHIWVPGKLVYRNSTLLPQKGTPRPVEGEALGCYRVCVPFWYIMGGGGFVLYPLSFSSTSLCRNLLTSNPGLATEQITKEGTS